jgi:hypothetical protein
MPDAGSVTTQWLTQGYQVGSQRYGQYGFTASADRAKAA